MNWINVPTLVVLLFRFPLFFPSLRHVFRLWYVRMTTHVRVEKHKKGQSVLITQANLMFPSISLLFVSDTHYVQWESVKCDCHFLFMDFNIIFSILYHHQQTNNNVSILILCFPQVNLCVIYCLSLVWSHTHSVSCLRHLSDTWTILSSLETS